MALVLHSRQLSLGKKNSSVACWTHQSKEENNIFCFEEIFRKKVLFLCCLWIRLMLAITWYDRHSHQPILHSLYYNGSLCFRNSTKYFCTKAQASVTKVMFNAPLGFNCRHLHSDQGMFNVP